MRDSEPRAKSKDPSQQRIARGLERSPRIEGSLSAHCCSHPTLNRPSQLPQPSLKKMIRPLNNHQLLRFTQRRHQRLQLRPRTKLIALSAHKQFRLRALAQKIEGVSPRHLGIRCHRRYRSSHADHLLHPIIGASRSQAHCRAKGKSRQHHRQTELRIQPIQRRSNIIDLAAPVIMFAVA